MENHIEHWNIIEVIAERLQIRSKVAEDLARLLEEEECTIPFIARYRKEQTDNMEADVLRKFSDCLKELREVQKKANAMMKTIEKQGRLDKHVERLFKSAQTMDELNHLYAPYKSDKKHSLAERARSLGLEEPALQLLNHPHQNTNLRRWVVKGVEGRSTLSDVERGVKHVIAEHVAKHETSLVGMRKIFLKKGMTLESKLAAAKKKEIDSSSSKNSNKIDEKKTSDEKYHLYYEFRCPLDQLKSYQVLAINRGEAQKQLTVRIVINEAMIEEFLALCRRRWLDQHSHDEMKVIVEACIDDAFARLVKPLVLRRARADLTRCAHVASVEVFSRNLKKLLLTAPVRGKTVLGVDPGYRNGCKCAVVSPTGSEILDTDVFNVNAHRRAMEQIQKLYEMHRFEVIAIGNGTACREAEQIVSSFIKSANNDNLVYCIVSENGASIYSVTDDAKKEMPDLDPNLRSAVSIARRFQDPLVELVKIDPKHLGVGMYQHDISEALLKTSLANVVEECVTFVGVDLNVAGELLLGRIAGVKASQAQKIIQWRNKNGRFVNRQQLLEVSGIGAKTFQQCAGFVRISNSQVGNHSSLDVAADVDEIEECVSEERKRKRKQTKSQVSKKKRKIEHKPNPLDQTWIHPESYDITKGFLNLIECNELDIGRPQFIIRVKETMKNLKRFASQLCVGEPTLQLIAEGLAQPTGFRDIRQESSKPLYRRTLKCFSDLRRGDILTGRITNVTDFGIFVDVGVGQDGLVHCSKIRMWEKVKDTLGPNDVVTTTVLDFNRNKLSLQMISYDCGKNTVL